MPRTRLLLLASLALACAVPAAARSDAPPALHARSTILIEAATGAVLLEEGADLAIAPASLTKLMTLHVALSRIEEGALDPSALVVPGPDAWAKNMPPRSSVMFLGPNQRLSVEQLLEGLVVVSGNDAAVALADAIGGSVQGFVALMNEEARRLGYTVMHFTEPAGISAANKVTAREYADFCRRFILLHPDALSRYFSLKQLTYPLSRNLTGGNHEKPVTQANRNTLLGRYPGADGLKTGYIDESGYNLAATATRDGMRLISVMLGVPDVGGVSGADVRTRETEALLDYGFASFTTVKPAWQAAAPVRVWKGRARTVAATVRGQPIVAVRRDRAADVKAAVVQMTDVEAPVSSGQRLGAVVVSLDGRELARFPLVAGARVERGGLLRRIVDSIAMFFAGVGDRLGKVSAAP
jgi:serine-type D-Ala-D-Ala carboxypeptidase (penicillin-binding protein 5/6)